MKKNMNKVLVIVLAVALLAMTIVAGTLAYLMADTDPIVNTFTVGYNVDITLTEKESAGAQTTVAARQIEYIPALQNVYKDPTITVTGNDCYVFVGIKKSANFDTYVSYALDSTYWETTSCGTLADGTEVYAAKLTGSTSAETGVSATTFNVLANKEVNFKNVSEMPGSELVMTFTGYAIQKVGINNVADAWNTLKPVLNDALQQP